MHLRLTGHHFEISDALYSYLQARMGKVERHCHAIIESQITLGAQRHRQVADATLRLAGHTVHATGKHGDMYAAIDVMVEKLDRQLRRLSDRRADRRRTLIRGHA